MAVQQLERVYKITTDATQAINQLDRIARSTGNIDNRMANLGNSIQSAFARIAAVGAVVTFGKSVLTASENLAGLQGSFKALLGDADRAADILERIKGIVKNTGVGINDASTAVQRLSIGLGQLGASNEQIALVAENFIKLGRISGSSIADINGALVQFSQSLAGGRLQGEELNILFDRVPIVVQLIAKEMGVAIGEIKKLAAEGKVTSDILANSLLRATADINRQFGELPKTFQQSMNILQLTWNEFLVSVGATSNLMDMLSISVDYVAKGLKDVSGSMSTIGLVGKSLQVVFQTVAIVVSNLAFIVTGITSDIGRLVSVVSLALSGNLAAIPELWKKVSEEQKTAREELDRFQAEIMGTIEPVKELGDKVGKADANLKLLSKTVKGELNPALKELQDLGQKRFLAIEGIALLEKLSPEAIKRLGVTVKDVADAIKKLQEVIDPSDAALRKFATSVQDSVNPANELVIYLAQLEMALAKGYISWNTYADATLKAMEKLEPEKLKETKDALDEIGVAIGVSISNGVSNLVDAFFEADQSFQEFASNFLTQIGKMILQMTILAGIKKSLGGSPIGDFLGFAKGGSFGGSTTLPKNTVLTEPTFFKFANGGTFGGGGSRMGVAGEAGPEAVMPLKRDGSGKLGVAGSPVIVNVNNNMSESAEVQVQETNRADGTKQIDVMIIKKIKQAIADGTLDRSMRGAYGLSRTPA